MTSITTAITRRRSVDGDFEGYPRWDIFFGRVRALQHYHLYGERVIKFYFPVDASVLPPADVCASYINLKVWCEQRLKAATDDRSHPWHWLTKQGQCLCPADLGLESFAEYGLPADTMALSADELTGAVKQALL